ncbi:MAG TPA: ABC transporter permease subunit [Gemmatimonadales bacterium]|nr:ABC transporter permease subunit [Gemmatimonadales bacterium]
MNRAVLGLFVRKEFRDLRSNRQLWPAFFLLPAVSIFLPLLLLALLPLLGDPARLGHDAGIDLLIQTVANDPTLRGDSLQERIARLLLRDLGLFYLLVGVILASGAAALALVREKEQRTLEPILATPIRDRDLLLAKLLAAIGPALLVAWGSAFAGSMTGLIAGYWRTGKLILPTAGNLVGWLLLAPALAILAALAALRVSARFTDVPGATQFTGLVVLPLSLIFVALLGRPAMASPLVGIAGSALVGLLSVWLFNGNARRFKREEILTRWR